MIAIMAATYLDALAEHIKGKRLFYLIYIGREGKVKLYANRIYLPVGINLNFFIVIVIVMIFNY